MSGSLNVVKILADTTLDGDPQLGFFTNASTGSSAEAAIYIKNGATTNDATFVETTGTGFTTTGGFVQDGGIVGTGTALAGGLSLMVRANADMRFYTNGHTNERMRITASGSVGIGTSSPSAKLDVVSSGRVFNFGTSATTTGNFYGALVYNGSDIALLGNGPSIVSGTAAVDFAISTGDASANMIFATSNTERMRITPAGNIIMANGNNGFQTSTKTASSGASITFSVGVDYAKSSGGDNQGGLIVINISQTNANVTNPNAIWVGTVINPRGSGSTTTQISTTKAAGISTLSVSGNGSNQIVVTASTSDGSGYRASMTFIGGGGTT
jgi:hypothetical protein